MDSSIGENYDLIIIGGGATGSGIALDASSRGYSVLLLEKDDFASGTSSKSSKLIHGGVRYLEKAILQLDKAQYDLVKEGLSERSIFLKNASHLSSTLKLDTPIYNYLEIFYIYTGLLMYKLISGSKSIGNNSFINKTLLALLQPSVKKDNLKGAVSFWDGRFLDSRMVIALLQTAQSYNAKLRNYSEVQEFVYDDKKQISGLKYFDKTTNEIKEVNSKIIINASGANVDNIRLLDDKNAQEVLALSSGIHIVLKKDFLPNDEGILISKTKDGRIIFVLPYLDKCLVGTTDDEVKYKDKITASEEEIKYLIEHINEYFDKKVLREDVLSSWSGIRPLIKPQKNKSSQQIVREHQIITSKNGLVSIAGGKWTTYRKMAEQLVDHLIDNKKLEQKELCKTKNLKVIGSQQKLKEIKKIINSYDISKYTKESLLRLYGDRAVEVLSISKEYDDLKLLDEELPYLNGEIIYTLKYEYVKEPIDFLARRISLCFICKEKALNLVQAVCNVMENNLNWDENKTKLKIKETEKLIKELF